MLASIPVFLESSASTTLRSAAPRRAGAAAWRLSRSALRGTLALGVLAAAWEILPRAGLVDRVFLPSLSTVLWAWWELLIGGDLLEQLGPSLVRSLSGLGLAVGIGTPLGILIAWYRPLAAILNPVLELFRNTAALALLPVFILILGIGETSKIAIVLYACIWPVLLTTISAVRGVEPLLITAARSMGLSSIRLFHKVVLPAAVPTIFTGIRLAGAASILVLIAAEMIGANAGLGFYIFFAQNNFEIPSMYAVILTISVLGLLINASLLWLERRFSSWRVSAR